MPRPVGLQHFQGLYSQAAKSDAFLISRMQDPDFQALTELLGASRYVLFEPYEPDCSFLCSALYNHTMHS